VKRREKERAVADAFHDVKVLINRFVRRGLRSDVVGQALLIGAALAAYDAKLDDLEFSDNALYAFAIAEAIRTGRKTVDTPVEEPRAWVVN
jgi:hypothetical protein